MTAAARPPTHRFAVLDDEECLRLLPRLPVGRLGFSAGALPVVLPVNFAVVDRTIVFCTEPGLKLDAALARAVACLEVDDYDVLSHSGWSVLATGRLDVVTTPDRLAAMRQLPVQPWAWQASRHYVELGIELLSGRRIGSPGY
jgi:nitroimidazol reductase NimA-like FMN-containing flavoprotein (pyridoxamine 5'-phosphate oxidase superfamily)